MEWQVVGVIVVLAGLAGTIVSPLLRLNTAITRLTVTMERLMRDLDRQKDSDREAHRRLWDKNDRQDQRLNDHETRITGLEKK